MAIEYPEKINEMGSLINTARKTRGLEPLYMVPYLNECANVRAREASEYWSHYRPNGDYFNGIIDYDIVSYQNIFENLAAGKETAKETMEQFQGSENHWATITNPSVTHMGIGVVYVPNDVNECYWYWCQLFSSDIRADYAYEGQYLPDNTVQTTGNIRISCIDKLTGNYFKNIRVYITSQKTIGGLLTDAKIIQNGKDIAFSLSSDKTTVGFNVVEDGPIDITTLGYGEYLLELNAPDWYYDFDHLCTGGRGYCTTYTYFTLNDYNADTQTLTFNFERFLPIRAEIKRTGKALQGIVYNLISEQPLDAVTPSDSYTLSEDKKILTFTSNDSVFSDDTNTFYNLPSGKYILRELFVPSRYIKAGDAVFTYNDNETIKFSEDNISGDIEFDNVESWLEIQYDKHTGAFENAINLHSVIIPKSVTSIGPNSFDYTALKSVEINSECSYLDCSFPSDCEVTFYE